jgi:hypothetical protein
MAQHARSNQWGDLDDWAGRQSALEEGKNQAVGVSCYLGGDIPMSNDTELLNTVRNALIMALPDDTPHDVIEDATLNVVQGLHAPWFPAKEQRIVGASNINVWALPGGKSKNKAPLGTAAKGTAVRAGIPENGWTPILFHGWVSGEMLG